MPYLAEIFLPRHNATFARPPRDPASAFVPLGAVDLDGSSATKKSASSRATTP